jgi:parallel beta-helix repeat protein
VENNLDGIGLEDSANDNIIVGNNITRTYIESVWIWTSFNNTFYHNSFTTNGRQVAGDSSTNTWDGGYPTGGNYWSDYKGTDNFSGPFQNRTGSDEIGDTKYAVDTNNTDNYPLMKPWTPNMFGDINGDGKVNLQDLVLLANAYSSKPGDAKWNPNADIDGNGIVGLTDLVIMAQHYGQQYP